MLFSLQRGREVQVEVPKQSFWPLIKEQDEQCSLNMAHQEFAERDFVVKISVPLSPDIFSILPRYICRNAPKFATTDGERCIHSSKFQIGRYLHQLDQQCFG